MFEAELSLSFRLQLHVMCDAGTILLGLALRTHCDIYSQFLVIYIGLHRLCRSRITAVMKDHLSSDASGLYI